MIRGDIVTVALPGDFGKPRPALIIQSDRFEKTATVTLLLLTSMPVDAPLLRLPIYPTEENGLRRSSHVMIDKIMTVRRDRVGPVIGKIGPEDMLSVTRLLAVFLGMA